MTEWKYENVDNGFHFAEGITSHDGTEVVCLFIPGHEPDARAKALMLAAPVLREAAADLLADLEREPCDPHHGSEEGHNSRCCPCSDCALERIHESRQALADALAKCGHSEMG